MAWATCELICPKTAEIRMGHRRLEREEETATKRRRTSTSRFGPCLCSFDRRDPRLAGALPRTILASPLSHAPIASSECASTISRSHPRCPLVAPVRRGTIHNSSRAPSCRFNLRADFTRRSSIRLSNLLSFFLRYRSYALHSHNRHNQKIADKPLATSGGSSLSHGNISIQLCLTPHLDLLHWGEDKACLLQ